LPGGLFGVCDWQFRLLTIIGIAAIINFVILPHTICACGKLVNAMVHKEQLEILALQSGGVFRTSDLAALGYTTYGIRKLLAERIIERIKPSYYRLYESATEVSEAMQIAQLFPDGVLCMHTALFYYRYSDRTPLVWELAFDRDTSKSRFKLDYPFVHPYYMKSEYLNFGVTTAEYEGCTLKIFDRDRLICECVYYEHKMDRESYNKAVQGYVADVRKNVPRLLEYATKRRVLKKVKNRIGVWL